MSAAENLPFKDETFDISGNFNGFNTNNIGEVNKCGLLSDNRIEKIDFWRNKFFTKYQYHMNFIVYGLILFIGQRSN